jgi:hypothetical protein
VHNVLSESAARVIVSSVRIFRNILFPFKKFVNHSGLQRQRVQRATALTAYR